MVYPCAVLVNQVDMEVSPFIKESGASHLTQALPEKVGRLVDLALNKVWNTAEETDMSIVKNMVKWQNFLSVWKFYRKLK